MDIMNTAADSLINGLSDVMKDIFPYIFALFLFSGVVKLLTPKIRGWIGEKQVSNTLKKLPKDYKLIDNILLRRADGTTTQIDHVVISVYGIFVIETKNYKGIITGSEYSGQWTKHMYKKKYKFLNPIRQNYGHIKTLEEVLNFPENMFVPIIVFTSDAKLQVKSKRAVINTKDLNKTIQNYKAKIINPEQTEIIQSKIKSSNIYSKKEMKKHVRSIHKKRQ